MTPDQTAQAQTVLDETKIVSPPVEALPLDSDRFSALLASAGIVKGSVDWRTQSLIGVTILGEAASEQLARSLRDGLGPAGQKSANGAVASFIRSEVFKLRLEGRGQLTATDIDDLEQGVILWLQAQTQVRRHFVPCTLFAYPLPTFSVGPVSFHHLNELPTPNMGVSRDEFWPDRKRSLLHRLVDARDAFRDQVRFRPTDEFGRTAGGHQYDRLVQLCWERRAYWVADIPVAGREQAQSIVVANLAASIALAALALALPFDNLRNMTRASELAAPVWSYDVWTSGGHPSSSATNHEPGRTLSPGVVSFGLSKGAATLDSFGRRLESYLFGQRSLPSLNESWCNAAYWFHDALLEPVEGVAVAQLETCIEVLLSAGSTTGSTSRLLSAFDALLGMSPTDPIAQGSSTSVKAFVETIVTARSRVLHGTWSALGPDLPQRNGLGVRRSDVEHLARTLLVVASHQLDAYQSAGEQSDNVLDLLAWSKARRTSASSAP
ncbi:hypothetical protein QE419_000581 [Brevundimonas vesicularis]|uniref:hypothetical protein n=1 Tax=Brevundimonas vesicularis TaxID=41276 RepID=UPI002786D82D|nr:hypothetical protein [Brevundimonas vesicularis]MDQ1191815.1 hypothetical protein [Brevundimonas vesicularis]